MPVEKGLAVVEARWESRGNYGVRPLFEMISALTTPSLNPHSIRHDMFYEATSLETVLKSISKTPRIEAVYIGSHGANGAINDVTCDQLIGILQRVNSGRGISGLYMAACEFGDRSTIATLLDPGNATGLQWVAGYSKEVEWLESAASDILFWSGYLLADNTRSLTKAKHGAQNLFRYMPNVGEQLGFGIFKWSKQQSGIVNLLI